MIPACPSLMRSFNGGKTEGTNSEMLCVYVKCCVCMFCFMFAEGLILWTDLRKCWYMRIVLKCPFAYEFDCPEVTQCGWQGVKLQLPTCLCPVTTRPRPATYRTSLRATWRSEQRGCTFLSAARSWSHSWTISTCRPRTRLGHSHLWSWFDCGLTMASGTTAPLRPPWRFW